MLLSIVIPIYNTVEYVSECLDSIINQDYVFNNVEIICINDGSTDGSINVLDKYACFDFIKIINKQNGGVSSARNLGLEIALGEYVWFVDSDDYIYKDSLNQLCNLLKTERPDIVSFSREDVQRTNPSIPFKYEEKFSIVAPSTFENIILKSILTDNNIKFNANIVYGEDILFWYQACLYCKRIIHIKCSIYYYRPNPNSISRTINTKEKAAKKINDLFTLITELNRYVNNGIVPKEFRIAFENMIRFSSQTIIFDLLPFTDLSFKETIEKLKVEKAFPFSTRVEGVINAFREKRLSIKIKKILLAFFPTLYCEIYYKRNKK